MHPGRGVTVTWLGLLGKTVENLGNAFRTVGLWELFPLDGCCVASPQETAIPPGSLCPPVLLSLGVPRSKSCTQQPFCSAAGACLRCSRALGCVCVPFKHESSQLLG